MVCKRGATLRLGGKMLLISCFSGRALFKWKGRQQFIECCPYVNFYELDMLMEDS